MEALQMMDVIKTAIKNRETLRLKVKHGGEDIIDIEYDPYVFGADTMQYYFLWGYMGYRGLYYRLMFDFITDAKLSGKKFKVQPGSIYYHGLEEEHYSFVEEVYGRNKLERN